MSAFTPLRAIGLFVIAALASLLTWWLVQTYQKSVAPLSADVVAHRLMQTDRAYDAALIFEDPLWKGVAMFRAERFQRAAAAFSQVKSIAGQYNLGVSYVHLKRYDDARNSFKAVLAQSPDHEDARHNLKLLEQLETEDQQNDRSGDAPDQGSQRQRSDNSAADGDERAMSAKQLPQEEAEASKGQSQRRPDSMNPSDIEDVRAGGDGSAERREELIEKLAKQSAGKTQDPEKKESDEQTSESGAHQDQSQIREAILADRIRLRQIADRPGVVLRARLRAAALRRQGAK